MTRGSAVRALLFTAAVLVLPLGIGAHWVLNICVFVLMYAALSSSWNLVGGFAGYPSLGHAAFFGIGAYTVALFFNGSTLHSGWEPFLVLPLVGVIAAVIGLPVAAIAMRTRMDVFAIVTITLLFVAQTLAFNLKSLTGGSQGMALPIPPFPAATFERPFYYVLAILLLASMGLTWVVLRTKLGLSLTAIRSDEDKAVGVGVHVMAVKLGAFCVSVAFAAMIGAVWAYYQSFIYPQFAFDPLITVAMVLMTFLGGRATLWGPVLGAVLLATVQQWSAYQLGGDRIYLVAYAAVFLVVMLVLPRGIVPTLRERAAARRHTARSAAAAKTTAEGAVLGGVK